MLINNSLSFGRRALCVTLVSLCHDGPPPEILLFFVLIFAHFQYVLIDIWISQRVSRQDASSPHFFSPPLPVPSEHEFIN